MNIDATVPIVTVVLDCTTDARHFHFCKAGGETKIDFTEHLDGEEEEPAANVLDFAQVLVRTE